MDWKKSISLVGWSRAAALLSCFVIVVGITFLNRPEHKGTAPSRVRDTSVNDVAFVNDEACAKCHRNEYENWSGSHHDLAMQPATPETVRGGFDNQTFSHFGVTSRFFRRDGRFFVNTEGPDGELADFELQYTFGVEPLQQYLAPFPGGRLQSLTIAWDTERNEWFHLYPDEHIRHDDPLHWTGRYQNWNLMCAACHSTHVRKSYDIDTDTYETTWAEIDVGCQACHGPGAPHLEWARTAVAERPILFDTYGLTSVFSSDNATSEIDACAPCHSRREQLTPVSSPGGPLLDNYLPARLGEGLYHPDGQILDEVYVYGSFVQSKMHAAGVRCSDCHDSHSLDLRTEGNALCIQCHRETTVGRFPMLQPRSYDTPQHHFHDPDSAGAQCINCHMPAKNYMVVDPRRDHSFRIPRPDLSVKLGTPNACTSCHADRDDEWAADVTRTWYKGTPRAHFGEILAAGRSGQQGLPDDLAVLSNETSLPAIVRATALELLRPLGQAGIDASRAALSEENPLLRAIAVGGLERLPLPVRSTALEPLLKDPVRAVRIAAARALVDLLDERGPVPDRLLTSAINEYLTSQTTMADLPSTHLNLGVVHEYRQDSDLAAVEYRIALRLEPGFLPARFNLANLFNRQRRNEEAEELLREGLEYNQNEAELYYSLGLILAEEELLEESVANLSEAARLNPERARIRYNYGLALQQVGRLADAETALREAKSLDAEDQDVLLALTRLLMGQQRWEEARTFATELALLMPTASGPQRLINEIQILERRNRR